MALYTLRSGASSHPEDSVLQFFTDLVSASGVISLTGNHFKVQAQATPDMTAVVKVGRAHVKGASANSYPVRMDADSNVTFNANSSGNPRIDAVVLYIDLSASPTSNANNVAKLIVVQGTPAASPSAPTDGDIQTAIGSANPFLRLANVTVTNGATSITTGNITDVRVLITLKGNLKDSDLLNVKMRGSYQNHLVDADGTTITFDMSESNSHIVTLAGNRTLAVSNVKTNSYFIIHLKQDGTGSRSTTWWSGIKWAGGTAPTLTTAPNKVDSFGFFYDGTDYFGYIVGQNL